MLVSWKMCDESRVVLGYESLAGDFELFAFRSGSEKSSIAETALRYSLWWMKKEKKMFCGGIEERVVEEGKREKSFQEHCAPATKSKMNRNKNPTTPTPETNKINRYRNLKNYGVMRYGEKRLGMQHWKTPRLAELQLANVPGMVVVELT